VRRLRTLLLAAAALLLGYLLAQTLAGGGRHTDRASTSGTRARERADVTAVAIARRPDMEPTSTLGPGPWRVLSGVPVGFARSERGAVAAAGNYLTMLSRALTPGGAFSWIGRCGR
jgi:hypothetical protein